MHGGVEAVLLDFKDEDCSLPWELIIEVEVLVLTMLMDVSLALSPIVSFRSPLSPGAIVIPILMWC